MKYIISFSGGIASAASAIVAHQNGLDYEIVFADTLIEDEDLYRFIYEIANKLEKPLIHLKDGRDPWDVFVKRKMMGNSRIAPCSRVLKTDQVKKWMKANCSPDDILVLGMYRDEQDRLDRAQKNWGDRQVRSLLIDHKIYPRRAHELVAELGVAEPRLYDMGFPHNNCGGMCVRAGQGQFATLLERKPEFYARQEARNIWAEETIGGAAGKGFIRVARDGETEYLNMREFRERVESGELYPKMYEMGGCGCFVDDQMSLFEED